MSGALILAGGASTRMGRDKAWILVDGQPLLSRVVDDLRSVCATIVIAARPGQDLPAFVLAGEGIERVDDPPAQRGGGPLVGIVAGLEQLARRGVDQAYLGSCDALGVTSEHVHFMLAQLDAAPEAALVIVEGADGRLHPLASAARVAAMLAHARAALGRGERRLQRVFGGVRPSVRVGVASLPDARALAPCNTPAELAALRDRLRSR